MLKVSDLTITPETIHESKDTSVWERVTAPDGRKFLVGSCDLSALDHYLDIHYNKDADKLADAVHQAVSSGDLDFFTAMGFIQGPAPTVIPEQYMLTDAIALVEGWETPLDTWVMEADDDWKIKNECGEHCETGVCNKRLASRKDVASQEVGYQLLLDFLNA